MQFCTILKFSTDQNPKKCKTKCIAFLLKTRELPNMFLCGSPLPWVDNLKHLGNMIINRVDGGQIDMRQKNAKYIEKHAQ